ncbi:MAG: RloB family protein [Candidatus Nanopelagicales bacterium]|nr:RloB family protein [Candidatus Nanopelagicales bacterium]MDZ4249267.1 RloB family protein [Candidatus Nanopelagicales bacterium]
MMRSPRRPILVVTEGYTEANYLEAVRLREATRHIRKIINAKGGGGIVQALERTNLDGFEEVWLVVDAEKHPHVTCARLRQSIEKQSAEDQTRVMITAPKFEAWLLAHFEKPTGTGARIEARLREHYGFKKSDLPKGINLDRWATAAARLEQLDLGVPDIPAQAYECPLCRLASGMSAAVELVGGSPSRRAH